MHIKAMLNFDEDICHKKLYNNTFNQNELFLTHFLFF